jgi:hypothetical protein
MAFFVAPGAVGNGLARLEDKDPKVGFEVVVVEAPDALWSPFMPRYTCRSA